jgi:hypothetical protein
VKFYRIDWEDDEPMAQTVDWATNQREANSIAIEEPTSRVTVLDVPTDRLGLLKFLKETVWRR